MRRLTHFFVIPLAALLSANAASAAIDSRTELAVTPKSGMTLRCLMSPGGGVCGTGSGGGGGSATLPDITCTNQTDNGGTNCTADGPAQPDDPNPSAPPHSAAGTPKPSSAGSSYGGTKPATIPEPRIKLSAHCAEIHVTNVRYCSTVASALQRFCAQQIPKIDVLCARDDA